MNNKMDKIGPGGRWLVFAGVPIAAIAAFFAMTLRDGNIRGVSEKYLPYAVTLGVSGTIIGFALIYEHVPKRFVIPLGIAGWSVAFITMCWFFWFGPGAIGYHR